MIKKRIKYFLMLLGIIFVIVPIFAYAAAGDIENPGWKGTLPELAKAIADQVVLIGGALLAIMIVWTGFLFISAGGNDAKISEAKKSLWWVIIGGGVLLGASAIADVVGKTFGAVFK